MSSPAGDARRDRLRRLRLRVAAAVATGFVALWGAVWAFGQHGGSATAAAPAAGGRDRAPSPSPSSEDGGFADPGTQAAPSQDGSAAPDPVITGQS
jgi:hypothetical protein